MVDLQSPMPREPGQETCGKTGSTLCNACFIAWVSVGLLVIAGLLLKLMGLI